MTLVKYNSNLEDYVPVTFSGLLDRFFHDTVAGERKLARFTPAVDIFENEKSFELQVLVPGMKKEDFSLSLENSLLVISGERKLQKDRNEHKFHAVETHYGAFSRSFRLPENVDQKNIEAEYKDGILYIEIPKDVKKAENSTIKIK
jgi:HSP20 family protein